MLPFGMTIPATVPQKSEIPEGLMNYPIHTCTRKTVVYVARFQVLVEMWIKI